MLGSAVSCGMASLIRSRLLVARRVVAQPSLGAVPRRHMAHGHGPSNPNQNLLEKLFNDVLHEPWMKVAFVFGTYVVLIGGFKLIKGSPPEAPIVEQEPMSFSEWKTKEKKANTDMVVDVLDFLEGKKTEVAAE